MTTKTIRPLTPEDAEAVIGVWQSAGFDAYTYLAPEERFTIEQTRTVFAMDVERGYDMWVGTEDGTVVAYLALIGSHLRRLYVDPAHQGQGWGTALIDHAKTLSPRGLEVLLHEQQRARAFYEHRGFVVARSPADLPPAVGVEESDVEYHWRPDASRA